VSSFQLEFAPRFTPEVGVLTNITQDHLYRHRTHARYAELKRSMFTRPTGDAVRAAVLPADDPVGIRLASELEGRAAVATFGADPAARWRVLGAESSIDRARVRIAGPGGELALQTRLPGPHNALNVAAALALADLCAVDPSVAGQVIGAFPGVPGRFQVIEGAPGFSAVVDYAHNPDGVARSLATARELVAADRGRVIALVSALDIYDHELCRGVGAAAARLADEVVITTNRYRPEGSREPEPGLAAGALRGRAQVRVIADRRAAIAAAVGAARSGDLVMVLGRGAGTFPLHEPSGEVVRATDPELVSAALAAL
jgi:UDP-N-acetylmuramoyl-L-alanyl-D-glutamate--2,6-diaminopimelate ligase